MMTSIPRVVKQLIRGRELALVEQAPVPVEPIRKTICMYIYFNGKNYTFNLLSLYDFNNFFTSICGNSQKNIFVSQK